MTLKVLTMKIMCEECDIEAAKKELNERYYSNTSIGMEDISFFHIKEIGDVIWKKH